MVVRRFKRKSCTVILLFNAFFIGVILISSYHSTNRLKRLKTSREQVSSQNGKWKDVFYTSTMLTSSGEKKSGQNVILFWTKYFGDDPSVEILENLEKAKLSSDQRCFANCRLVFDKNYLGISDAVVFHSRDLRNEEMPTTRTESQAWVYMQQESPANTVEDLSEYSNVFNWTMTYRRDSDVHHPYNRIYLKDNDGDIGDTTDYNKILSSKTKLVAWVVSNCNTKGKREFYTEELENFISVDIYGSCGDFVCSRLGDGCFSEIEREYKFYLSFENSLCKDYISEKFFNALQFNLVPVVYGGGNYEAVAPPGSYINAKNFASPKALADYLLYLDKHPEEYLQYFKWKSKYKVGKGDGWCRLCEKVTMQKIVPVYQVYRDLWKWWNKLNYNASNEQNEHLHDWTKSTTEDSSTFESACDNESGIFNKSRFDIFTRISKDFRNLRRWLKREVFG